jgi:hypothetical protein
MWSLSTDMARRIDVNAQAVRRDSKLQPKPSAM